jgi:hypothetical protein
MDSDAEDVNYKANSAERQLSKDSARKNHEYTSIKNATVEGLLEFVVSICINSVVDARGKPLGAVDTVLKVSASDHGKKFLISNSIALFLPQSFPPAYLEHRVCNRE